MRSGYRLKADDRKKVYPVLSPRAGKTMRCWLVGNVPWRQLVHWTDGRSEACTETPDCVWCHARCRKYSMWYLGVEEETGNGKLVRIVVCLSDRCMSRLLLTDQDGEPLNGKLMLVGREAYMRRQGKIEANIDLGRKPPGILQGPFDVTPSLRHVFQVDFIGAAPVEDLDGTPR